MAGVAPVEVVALGAKRLLIVNFVGRRLNDC
jgi:hypothetical protein